MGYFYAGTNLLLEWIKTFIIFAIIDKLLMGRKIKEIVKNHDTYLSSLIVSAFLIIFRNQQHNFATFLLWAVMVMVIYTFVGILFRLFVKP